MNIKLITSSIIFAISASSAMAQWERPQPYPNPRYQPTQYEQPYQEQHIQQQVNYETTIVNYDHSLIQDFKVKGVDNLQSGQVLKFIVDGQQDGSVKVKFSSDGKIGREIKLSQIEPGRYVGSYTVRPSDKLAGQTFTSILTFNKIKYVARFEPATSFKQGYEEQPHFQQQLKNPNFGSVLSIQRFEVEPDSVQAPGAIIGGVAGGLLGNQVGKGTGKDLATIAGVVGGAFAGNAVQKNMNRVVKFKVVAQFEDNTTQEFIFDQDPYLHPGAPVVREGNTLRRR